MTKEVTAYSLAEEVSKKLQRGANRAAEHLYTYWMVVTLLCILSNVLLWLPDLESLGNWKYTVMAARFGAAAYGATLMLVWVCGEASSNARKRKQAFWALPYTDFKTLELLVNVMPPSVAEKLREKSANGTVLTNAAVLDSLRKSEAALVGSTLNIQQRILFGDRT